jgi:hypothetical protein
MTHETSYLTMAQTCAMIGRSRWTVHRLIKDGTLKAKKRGTARNAEVRVAEDSVTTYLAGRPIEPAEASA